MLNSSQDWQPVLPYPSWDSVAELTVAMIERSSSVIRPDGWPDEEPLYIGKDDATNSNVFRKAIDDAIQGAEPGRRLSEELAYFERVIAEYALECLESQTSGQAMLDELRTSAVVRFLAEQRQQEGQLNDTE